MTEQAPSLEQRNKNRKAMLILAAVFILPVVLAKIALEADWFNKAATNRGELLDPVLDFRELYLEREPKWYILHVSDNECGETCKLALYSINQVWFALGKHQDRVIPLALFEESVEQPDLTELTDQIFLQYGKAEQQQIDKVFKDQSTDGIFIVDALGNIILRYQRHEQQQQAVLSSRDILADMKKLLKLSRIG